ncbi:MAG: hypothetical protein AB7S72_02225 [Draconibacterium sp.]
MIIFILAASSLAAQDDFIIYEGTQLNYRVGLNNGNTYAWNVVNGTNGAEFDFTTNPAFYEVGVTWNIAGSYIIRLTESHPSGCSTTRELPVQVQPNNRSIGFGLTASTECFSLTGNDFQLALSVLDNNGSPLPVAYFPLSVQFTVNGAPQSQLLSFNDQQLLISNTMFTALPDQNSPVEVVLSSVTDVKNAPVQPGANGTHLRTIFAIPEIEFTEELRRQYYDKEGITAYSSFVSGTGRVEPK